jgi:hypothetical protein
MKHVRLLGVSLLTVATLAWPEISAAQDKTARGTVSALVGDSVTVKVGATDMKFTADSKTSVVAAGAGTKARTAAAAGQPGPKLAELLKPGQAVIVTYREMGAMLHATQFQVVSSAGPSGGTVAADKPAEQIGTGAVKSVAANSLTITAAGGKEMTFAIDATTRVVGQGAGTKTAAAGGRTAITDLVKAGNRVSVNYHEMGGTLHAATVRVVAAQ